MATVINPVSSCITTYKKNPPPVPPRTTIKPFISITAQSSTESAQDAYLDGHTQRGDLNSVSGLSNSTESLDSVKALTAAIEAANAQVHGPSNSQQYIDSPPATNKGIPPVEEPKWDVLRKSKCSSVGIQVDGPEQLALADMHTHKFQSVGIQVETEKCFRRFTRSNSVTTAVQADLDSREHSEITVEPQEVVSSPLLRQLSKDTCTASFLGSEDNHLQARAQENAFDSIFDPSFLPPPEPWIDSTSEAEVEAGQRSVCQRDGRWFMKLLQAEKERMDAWCQQMEKEEQENALSEEILGKIRSAVGSAQLLMSQKFQQFSGLQYGELRLPRQLGLLLFGRVRLVAVHVKPVPQDPHGLLRQVAPSPPLARVGEVKGDFQAVVLVGLAAAHRPHSFLRFHPSPQTCLQANQWVGRRKQPLNQNKSLFPTSFQVRK